MSTEIIREYLKLDTCSKHRTYIEYKCDNCGKLHEKQKRFLRKTNFCSKQCMGFHKAKNSTKFHAECAWCKKIFQRHKSKQNNSKSGIYFCCKPCKNEGQKIKNNIKDVWPNHYKDENITNSYRRIAFENHEHKCNRCGYNKIVEILQVHHKDRNRVNNLKENLEIICPNCHQEEHFLTDSGLYTRIK